MLSDGGRNRLSDLFHVRIMSDLSLFYVTLRSFSDGIPGQTERSPGIVKNQLVEYHYF